MLDLEAMTLTELKALAKEHNIKNISKLKKDDLITVLKQVTASSETSYNQEYENNNNDDKLDELDDKETTEKHYDENGEPIVDYKLTNEGDEIVEGILDILPDGYGFLRGDNYLSSDKDVYISMVQIRRFKIDTGDVIKGI